MERSSENDNTKSLKNDKIIVIGIGGVSRAGKSSCVKRIKEILGKECEVINFDNYLINPIMKYDEKIQAEIEDWEDSACYNIDKFYLDLKTQIREMKNGNLIKYLIVEGFLIYSRQDLIDLFDKKILLDVDMEVARERRKSSKYYGSDYYFNEYIWKGWLERR